MPGPVGGAEKRTTRPRQRHLTDAPPRCAERRAPRRTPVLSPTALAPGLPLLHQRRRMEENVTWGLLLPSSARTPGAGMFVPAPVSKAAPALKEELTNGHCDGVAHGTVFSQHPQRTESPKQPKVPPCYRDVISSRPPLLSCPGMRGIGFTQ